MRRAFTLIELLVVVAIMAMLTAMMLPALRSARLRAQETACAAGLRQLSTFCVMYTSDSTGRFPSLQQTYGGTSGYANNLYFSFPSWRRFLESTYHIGRDILNAPTNPSWNKDDLYYWEWDGKNPDTATAMVFGRFYFCSLGNSDDFYAGLVAAARPPASGRPVFPATMSDHAFTPLLWADLNRVSPSTPGKIDWSTPGDPRIGATHLYGSLTAMPAGTHLAKIDGSVEWEPGTRMQRRATFGGVDLWW